MRRTGILNPALGHLLSSTGHTDFFTVSDRGFPVPDGPERIDLALVDGIPTVLDVLRAIHAEWVIDRLLITEEMERVSPQRVAEIRDIVGDVPVQVVTHLELKRLAPEGKATVRTGDSVPYANIILVSG